jgi:NTP pyrophosphatase (non-canonical NTP hydrolase)
MKDIKEILLILQEECAEVIQAISKCERFGANNYKPGKQNTNKDHLEEELGDLLAMIELLEEKGFVNWSNLELAKEAKYNKLKQWSNIQID